MIGNAADAALAATRPTGYLLGEGTSRYAYLINGVVYKVNISSRYADNEFEFSNINRLKGITHPLIRFPEVSMYDNVIAMEYISGDATGYCFLCEVGDPCDYEDCIPGTVASDINRLGIIDLAFGNVIKSDGLYYVIDCVS